MKHPLEHIYASPKNKDPESARKNYLNTGLLLLKSSRNQQLKGPNTILKQLNFKARITKLKPNMSHDNILFSDRKSNQKEMALRRQISLKQRNIKEKSNFFKSITKHSNSSRLNSSTSRLSKLQKTEKSTMLSEIQSANNRLQKLKQDQKAHQNGKNCRVIIIQGTNEEEHYVTVDKIDDIMLYLRKEYPRYAYYKSIPSQLTMDYFLIEGKIDGKFLHGQSLYLKPCGRVSINALDEKEQIGLQSFQIIKLIGSGGFSKVFLCRFKEDGRFYAMKVIDKDVIVKNKKKRIIMNERNIMKSADHPFVIEMKFAFQSEKYLVFVMEYCAGGELFGLIKKHRRLEQAIVRFYIIEIFLGLSYLHSQKVVYRDIKPQNILLSQNGHVKIADLGLAKPDMFEGELAYSFCGSPEYMSPQMILQVGHTYPVDYYCMGALLYELLTGLPPFYSRDPNEIYEAVLSEELTFPSDVPLTTQCKNLLKSLLCKEPKQRLGSMHGVKEILAHPWFGKNKYQQFIDLQIEPPSNFCSIAKINLDDYTNEEKSKKQVEEVKKEQKIQRKKFKQVMKKFYYDYREKCSEAQYEKLKQKTDRHQKIDHSPNFKRKSSSKKKQNDCPNQGKKENVAPKITYLNLEQEENNLNLLLSDKSSIKKETTRGSRNKLFKQKVSSQNLHLNFKNFLNSEIF